MVEDMKKGGGQGRARRPNMPFARKPAPGRADEDDADVFDRVIGEEPLQVMLHERIEHAEDGVMAAERQDEMLHHQRARRPDRT